MPGRNEYEAYARKVAKQNGIPEGLFVSLVTHESGWKANARSPVGAYGLAQLMPQYHDAKDVQDPFRNLAAGARELGGYYKQFGNWRLALAAYNAGPNAVKKYGGIPPYSETTAYVRNVLADAGKYGKAPSFKTPGIPSAPEDPLPAPMPSLTAPLPQNPYAALPTMTLQSIASGNYSPQYTLSKIYENMAMGQGQAPALSTLPLSAGSPGQPLAPTTAGGNDKIRYVGKLVLPLSTKMGSGSEFTYVDAEGAPDSRGVRHHAGKDWFGPAGTAVMSPITGRIVEVKQSRGTSGQVFGGVVKVQAPNGMVFVFRHVVPGSLRVGQKINAGSVIASVSPWTDGSTHTHIEIWKTLSGGYRYENMLDPADVFSGRAASTPASAPVNVPAAAPVAPASPSAPPPPSSKQGRGPRESLPSQVKPPPNAGKTVPYGRINPQTGKPYPPGYRIPSGEIVAAPKPARKRAKRPKHSLRPF